MGKLARFVTITAIAGAASFALAAPAVADHWENQGPYAPKAACEAAGAERVADGAIGYACKWIGGENYNLWVHYA